ncbi:MAG: hypothetical protein RMJ14_04230 [Nitrososphaerota archaeon]|nr:hypothetical protein [Aigarchaeota archaeon]MDW8076826.1 hypothetical protein [Nitrososphaerota archaeon]
MLTVVCGHCGYVLYEGNELKTLNEVVREYANICPKCGKTLKPCVQNIKISKEGV